MGDSEYGTWKEAQILGIDPSPLTDTMRDVADTAESVAVVLDAIATLLEAIAALLIFPDNPLKAIVNAIINALSGMIEDLLSNNVAVAIHHNFQHDPRWRITRSAAEDDSTRSSGKSPNLEDGDIPYTGTGLPGWFHGLLSSVRSTRDPWAPVQNGDANCAMVIMVKGMPTIDGLADFWPIVKDLWFNWDTERFSEYEKDCWVTELETRRHLARLGSAFGCKKAHGIANYERETAWENIKAGLEDRLGDVGEFPTNMLSPESMPIWRSIPIARIFGPPLQEILEALRDLLNSLKFPADDTLRQMVLLLAKKVEQLSVLIAKISRIIDAIAAIIDFFFQVHFIVIPPAEDTTGKKEPFLGNGGITGCMIDALSAEGAPDYGPNGVVVGTVALVNLDTGMDNLVVLGSLLSMDIMEALKNFYGPQLDAINEAWDGVEDAAGDATWNNVAPVPKAGADQTLAASYDETDPESPVIDLIVTVDGSQSADENEGDVLTYEWTFSSVASGSGLTFTDITGRTNAIAAFTPDVVGTYILRLQVDDGTADAVSDTTTVTIVDPE